MNEIIGSLISVFEQGTVILQARLGSDGKINSRFDQFEVGICNEMGELKGQTFEIKTGAMLITYEICKKCHNYILHIPDDRSLPSFCNNPKCKQ